jgi:DNA repair protein RadD
LRPGEDKDHLIVLDHAGNHHRLGIVVAASSTTGNPARLTTRTIRSASLPSNFVPTAVASCLHKREIARRAAPRFTPRPKLSSASELVELGSRLSGSISDRHAQECAKKDLWHGALIKIAKQKGYAKAHGWAAHKFREKFGHRPTLNYPPEREPTVEILNWVRSRNIAFAKARARYG